MKTKQLFKNLTVLLVVTVGIFTIYSFTNSSINTDKLASYDQSLYQDIDIENNSFSFDTALNEGKCGDGKCGDDKKAKKAKEVKDSKYGDDKKVKEAKDSKCGAGKCGDDKKVKETKDSKCGNGKCGDDKKENKKADEGKDAKCGTGKCG